MTTPREHQAPQSRSIAVVNQRPRHIIGSLLSIVVLAGCRPVDKTTLTARATDQWIRSYPLAAGGEFQIVGGNGAVDIRAGDGQTVEVSAERVAIAATEASAKQIVPRIQIREDVTPDKVVVQSVGLEGLVIGVDVTINYRVTVPKGVAVRVRTVNGAITVDGVDAKTVLNSGNGAVTATNLRGGVEVRTINGPVSIDLAAVGENAIDLRTANGRIKLTLPATTDATLTVSSVNGVINFGDLKTEPVGEQTRRRQRVRLNKGGAPIDINIVNGEVRISARP